MGGALLDSEKLGGSFGVKTIMAMVCYECEYLQIQPGRYSSRGSICGECGERLETYKISG